MTKPIKCFLYALTAAAAIGLVIILWWLFGKLAGVIALALGGGGVAAGRKTLQKMAQAEADQEDRNETIRKESRDEQDQIEWDRRTELAAVTAKELQAKMAREAVATKAHATVSSQIDNATTTQQLDAIEDEQLAKLEAMLPPEPKSKGDRGFARVGFVALLILIVLCGMAIMGSAVEAKPATSADKARAAKRTSIIIRARKEIQRLKDKLKANEKRHHAETKALKAKHASELKSEQRLRQSDAKACAAKVLACSSQSCPATWPAGVIGGGVGMLLGAVGCGIFIASNKPPKTSP